VEAEIKNKPIMFMFNVHGASDSLGLGINKKIYSANRNVVDFYNSNGPVSPFVNVLAACGQHWLADIDDRQCCWPQTWLGAGAWSVFQIDGDPYHHSFERWLFKEKIVGQALRRTFHTQDMIYGDILGVMP
jgi:hypothetical protein